MKAEHPQERPPGFTYRRGKDSFELHADQIPLARLAARYGTPLYVYSATTIRQRYRSFDRAFAKCEHTICYSVKANSNLSILRMLGGMGAGFDIVSVGELQRVLAVGRKSAAKVVFSGVGKQAGEIDQALHAGILMFNVESPSELTLLAARAAHHRKCAQFAVRVNPHVAAKTHPYISTGLHEHKFGVPWRDAPELYRRGGQEPWLRAAGVSVHIGSQITDVGPFHETMQRIATLVRALRQNGHDIRYLDGGGGLGIFYQDRPLVNFAAQAKQYAKALTMPLKGLGIHLLLEPGRAIIGPAGVLLTRVIYRKRNDGKQFVVVDAAMNDLLRPSLYNAYHEIVPVNLQRRSVPHYSGGRAETTETVDIVGPVCETGDFFAHDRALPRVEEGELLAILDTGAYGMSLASNYNSRPRAAEVLVDGARARLARKRESMGDLLALERS